MTAELIGNFETHSVEWHAARANGIGGSEIAAILGLSKWESRYGLWLRKKGIIPERATNSQMTVGEYVEDSIVSWWVDNRADQYHDVDRAGTYRSAERPWQIANPDRLISDDELGKVAVLECKFQIWEHEWGADGSDNIPPYYLAQCRWYLDVFGLDTCHVAVLFGGSGRFAEFVVHPNDDDTRLMREAGEEFMASLESNERPDIDAHDVTYLALREERPEVGSGDIEVSGEVRDQYVNARAQLDAAKTAAQYATNRVLGLLNDCEAKRATYDGKPIAFKKAGRNGAPAYLQASPAPKESA